MRIDAHSVVYFINEEHGVVIKANGATGEVAIWEKKSGGFTRRIDLENARFIARVDRFEGRWCPAHPTYRLSSALAAARLMQQRLPNKDGMKAAEAAKRKAQAAELNDRGVESLVRDAIETWHRREAQYAGI